MKLTAFVSISGVISLCRRNDEEVELTSEPTTRNIYKIELDLLKDPLRFRNVDDVFFVKAVESEPPLKTFDEGPD